MNVDTNPQGISTICKTLIASLPRQLRDRIYTYVVRAAREKITVRMCLPYIDANRINSTLEQILRCFDPLTSYYTSRYVTENCHITFAPIVTSLKATTLFGNLQPWIIMSIHAGSGTRWLAS